MMPWLALSMLAGGAVGFPLLQWGLGRRPEALLAFEGRCRLLSLPLLAAVTTLLFQLYTWGYALVLVVIGGMLCGATAAAGRFGWLPNVATGCLLASMLGSKGAAMRADSHGRYLLSPATRVEVAGRRAVPGFLRSLTTDTQASCEDVRTASRLYRAGEPRALPVLILALRSSEPCVADEAAEQLRHLGPRVAPGLVAAILSGAYDEGTERRLAESLWEIADPRTVPALLAAVARPALADVDPPGERPDRSMRLRAVQALVPLRDPRAFPALQAILEDEREAPDLRAGVAWALAELSRTRAAPVLIRALRTEADLVRNAAAEALATLGPRAVPGLLATLAASLERPGRDLGEGDWAAWALVKIGDPRARPLLAAADRRSHYRGEPCVFCGASRQRGVP